MSKISHAILLIGFIQGAAAFNAGAAGYPERPIRFIVASAAGGATDITARILCAELSRQMGVQFVVDNRAGGSGVIGTELIVRAAPDGYTIGNGNFPVLVANRLMFAKLPYDLDRDLRLISQYNSTYNILAVTLSLPVKSVKDLIEYARNNPGKLLFASNGNGTSPHLSGELFKRMTGIQMTHVPFKAASQAVGDMIAGQIHVYFENAASVGQHFRAGRVRGLAVTTPKRTDAYPE